MSGACKSFRLNDPMPWAEYKSMPDDIKVTYIKLLLNKFDVPFNHIGTMLGVSQKTISAEIVRLGLSEGKSPSGRPKKKWDKEGFYAWVNGVDSLPTPVPEEDVQEEEDVRQEEAQESFVQDDLPWDIPEPVAEFKPYCPAVPQTACPSTGSLSFKCPANVALNTLKELLQNEMVAISITWRVMEEGGDDDV